MNNHLHYTPILKWKQGEYKALSQCDINCLEMTTPLIEIPPIQWDFDREVYKKSLESHVQNFGQQLSDNWQLEMPLYLDANRLQTPWIDQNVHVYDECIRQANACGKHIIPVTSLDRDMSFQTAVSRHTTNGICIRITPDEITTGAYDFNAVCEYFQLPPEAIDIIIDLESIASTQLNQKYSAVVDSLIQLPFINQWRSLTVAGTSYPESMGEIKRDIIDSKPRLEWELWNRLISAPNIPRLPRFGDYSIAYHTQEEVNPKFIQMSAAIRYSSAYEWVFVKGRSARTEGWEQTQDLCAKLIRDARYSGENFSSGDKYIWDRAHGNVGPGNSSTWRQVGNSHHITLVTHQLANLRAV